MERAAILCKGPPGEGVGECTARRASTIPRYSPPSLLEREHKTTSLSGWRELLSCARARPAGHWGCRSRATKSLLGPARRGRGNAQPAGRAQFPVLQRGARIVHPEITAGKVIKTKRQPRKTVAFSVGVLRLERRTLCSQSRYANQLRHTPNSSADNKRFSYGRGCKGMSIFYICKRFIL